MITVEQIRQLENGVRQAIDVINSLKDENKLLKTKLSGYEERIEELEVLIESFKKDQSSIEDGIINALHQLDVLEDIFSKDEGELPENEQDSISSSPSEENSPEPQAQTSTENTAEPDSSSNEKESSENELDIF